MRGARERAQLNGENIRPRQAKAQTAHAEERIGFAGFGESRNRLVAAGVERSNRHRTLAGPAQHRVVGEVLRLLVGQAGGAAE